MAEEFKWSEVSEGDLLLFSDSFLEEGYSHYEIVVSGVDAIYVSSELWRVGEIGGAWSLIAGSWQKDNLTDIRNLGPAKINVEADG